MKVGVIGLGKMGAAIAYRLHQAGHEVYGFDAHQETCNDAQKEGINCVSLQELARKVRVFWLMVPAGKIVDDVIAALLPLLQKKDIIIDGGNSHFDDSVRRERMLVQHDMFFIDCGTSGGLFGKEHGFSLMIGGNSDSIEHVQPLFKAIAAPEGYAHVGPAGAGHYVKMVHNGIEYALMQAYAEGFHLLKDGRYKNLDMAQIANVWQHGAVIRSWLLELTHAIFVQGQKLDHVSGEVQESGTGAWTVEEAHEQHIPVQLIEDALAIRKASRETGGNYATKIVALLRHQFGGHAVKKI